MVPNFRSFLLDSDTKCNLTKSLILVGLWSCSGFVWFISYIGFVLLQVQNRDSLYY